MTEPARILVVQRRVAGPVHRVFDRFIEGVDLWWLRGPRFRQWPDSTVCFVGNHLLERRGDAVVQRARVLHRAPPHHLHLQLDGARVELEFTADDDHTRVTVRHHRPTDGRTAFADPMGVWWAELLAGLDRPTAS